MGAASTTIPVLALTGHLGAGKTTLPNHVLHAPGARIGVVINDFGELNVNAGLATSRAPFGQKKRAEVHPEVPRPCRCGRSRRVAKCATPCVTTAARCCGWPTSGPPSTTRRSVSPTTSTGPRHNGFHRRGREGKVFVDDHATTVRRAVPGFITTPMTVEDATAAVLVRD